MLAAELHVVALVFLCLGGLCAVTLAIDVLRRPQHMAIMNLVWPVCALFGGLWVSWLYFTYSRAPLRAHQQAHQGHHHHHSGAPFAISVANDTLHCGAGCTLGDIIAEWLIFMAPALLAALGYGTVFSHAIYASWVLDFLLAFLLGIVFQYFAIAPMQNLGLRAGLAAALKADTLSLVCWQIGMYAFMAFAQFWLGPIVFHTSWQADSVEFWFLMQCAMACGYVVAYPANWWLVRKGIKSGM